MLSPVAFFSALGRTACRGSAAAADPDERCYRLYRPACGCATRGFGTVCLVNRTSFTLLALVGAVLLARGLFAFQMPVREYPGITSAPFRCPATLTTKPS